MKKAGVTGGIGSGKSTACRIFEMLGIAVFYSDHHAAEIMNNDPDVRSRIEELFGPEAYFAGTLNRNHIASRVFSDNALLAKLNAIVHPAVEAAFLRWAEMQQGTYVIEETAILFESGAYRNMDYTVTINAPEELRLQRAMKRDGAIEESIRARMANQLSDRERAERADFVLTADDHRLLIPQIVALHEKLSSL